MKLNRGILIAIEGIDGSGKSTLARNLAAALKEQNLPVVLTKEPGGTALGTQLRTILQHHPTKISPQTEFLLFAADRAQHFFELVIPHLKNNAIVISDRMADSSLVYQGYGRGLDKEFIKTVNAWAMNNTQPNLTLYVHVPYEVALQRIAQRNAHTTRFEQEDALFTQKLIEGFTEIAALNPHGIIFDGTQSEQAITHNALEAITQWMHTHAR